MVHFVDNTRLACKNQDELQRCESKEQHENKSVAGQSSQAVRFAAGQSAIGSQEWESIERYFRRMIPIRDAGWCTRSVGRHAEGTETRGWDWCSEFLGDG